MSLRIWGLNPSSILFALYPSCNKNFAANIDLFPWLQSVTICLSCGICEKAFDEEKEFNLSVGSNNESLWQL